MSACREAVGSIWQNDFEPGLLQKLLFHSFIPDMWSHGEVQRVTAVPMASQNIAAVSNLSHCWINLLDVLKKKCKMHIANLLFSVTKWRGHCSRAGNNGCPLASTSGQPKLLTKDTELTHNELLQWEGRLKRVQFPTQLAVFYSFKCQGDGVQRVPLWGALLTATVLQQERQREKGWKWRDGRVTTGWVARWSGDGNRKEKGERDAVNDQGW